MIKAAPVTVVEMDGFLSATRKMMNDTELSLLVNYLAYNPLAGDIVAGTGGVRKLRWGLEGRGKRGGARIIYYYHDQNMPLYAYAKNDRSDLSGKQKNELKLLTATLFTSAQGKRR